MTLRRKIAGWLRRLASTIDAPRVQRAPLVIVRRVNRWAKPYRVQL